MKVYIKCKYPIKERRVIDNLQKLGKIMSNPFLRLSLKATLPTKYRRGALGFTLEREEDIIVYRMKEDPVLNRDAKNKITAAINELIVQCEGKPNDFLLEFEK